MEKLENEKYNGWSNRDSWLVALWINNEESNYNFFKNEHNKKVFSKMNARDFRYYLRKYLKVTDKIIFKNVNVAEIKECINEL